MSSSAPMLGRRFEEAVVYASVLHADQFRKGTTTPYIAHLLGVTALVLEDGGDEDEAIAALLHDSVEDRGGRPRLEDIRGRFGEEVARMVEECSDSVTERPGMAKEPWWLRKQRYIAHLPDASAGGLRVSLADKVHNARAIVRDATLARDDGERTAFWRRFSTGADGQLWYFRSLLRAFRKVGVESHLLAELELLVGQLEEVVPAEAHAKQAELPPVAG